MSKKEKKIQDYDPAYSLLHRYVDFVIKHSYRHILHVDKENIPKDGAIIFAPNHTNALMDALVMLCIDRRPKVFVARADIFRNRRLARFLTFLKIMPIMRQRDGFQAVKKNQEIINKSVDVLKDRIPFCIFPEGTHQAKYSSLPLSKGIFRIALQAHELMPDVPLYIVPVGLHYGDFFRYRSTVRVQFGRPINVGQYLAENDHLSPQEQTNGLKDLLTERMHKTIFHLPNDDDYPALLEVCHAVELWEKRCVLRRNRFSYFKLPDLEVQFWANNATKEAFEALRREAPEKAEELLELAREAEALRRGIGIDADSVKVGKPLKCRTKRVLFSLVTLPYILGSCVLASPLAGLCQFLFTKLKDPAFRNSLRFVMNLFVWPLLLLVYAILAFAFLPWMWAIAFVVLALPAPYVAHEGWKTVRLLVSDYKLLRTPRLMELYWHIRGMWFKI